MSDTHGVPIQVLYSEEPGSFSGVLDEYAEVRGLSKADAKGELMRIGLNLIMMNVYENCTSIYPHGQELAEQLGTLQATSILHILKDTLPHWARFFHAEAAGEPAPTSGAKITMEHAAEVLMPGHPPAYHSGMSGVDITIVRGGERPDGK